MSVLEAWGEPLLLDLAEGDIVEESHWDAILSNLLYLGRKVEPLFTNISGGALAEGDCVFVTSAGDTSINTTTTADLAAPVGIVKEAIANAASGRVQFDGLVRVKVTGSVARGEYLITSTVAGSAKTAGSARTQNSFARAVTADSAGYCYAIMMNGSPNIKFARQTTAPTVVNSTVLVNTSLTFDIAAGETWVFFAIFVCSGTTSVGSRVGVNGPSAPTDFDAVAWGGTDTGYGTGTASAYGVVMNQSPANPSRISGIAGYVQNGANAGTVAIQFANGTSPGTTTFAAGGILVAIRVA